MSRENKPAALLSGKARKKLAVSSTKWNSIPDLVMHTVHSKLALKDQKSCRLVSKHWCFQITEAVKAVQLSVREAEPHISTLEAKFPCLVRVSFLRVRELRDSHLQALASSQLPLGIQELHIGEFLYGEHMIYPESTRNVSETGMEAIASITTLKKVTLMSCHCIPNAGIQELGSLTRLEELRIMGCSGITEQGMGFVQDLPKLHSLTIFQCHQVNNELWGKMGRMPHLKHLHLGNNILRILELTEERLEDLWDLKESRPEELTLSSLRMTPDSLLALARYKSLKALGMTKAFEVTAEMALNMLQKMTQLERLNLSVSTTFTDSDLILLSKSLRKLQHLTVDLGSEVTSSGIRALAGLPDLQGCSLKCNNASPEALEAVSTLTGLTHAEFPACPNSPHLTIALQHLTNLQYLSLKGRGTPTTLDADTIVVISGCLSLRSLDLSNREILITAVRQLLRKLVRRDKARKLDKPMLQEVDLHYCGFDDSVLDKLNKSFPTVRCHKKTPFIPDSSTWVGISKAASMT